ncbi:SRPBCC family protein [Spirosoma sp.]|uniref:SRPBCC family protein n=1 Tax=Spirosoma sp. TaxID=1899569 RepID=UPI003B3AF9D7
MHLYFETQVNQPISRVWTGFNQALFKELNPPFPPVKIIRFDGCLQGDVVHIELNFFVFRQDWISLIVEQQTQVNEIFFVDQGTKLPFFLRYWQHRHRLLRTPTDVTGEQTIIIDDITFRTPFLLTDYLLYPILWLQFAYRKPIYRRWFSRL